MNIQFNSIQGFITTNVSSSKVVSDITNIFNSKNHNDNNSLAAIMKISKDGMKKLNQSRIKSKEEIIALDKKIYESQETTLKTKQEDLKTTLENLKKSLSESMSDVERKKTKQTEYDLLDAQEQLRQLKEEQEKMYELKQKEAQDIANKSTKQTIKQQHDYAELYMLKKSLEEQNEDEDEKSVNTSDNVNKDNDTSVFNSNGSLIQSETTPTPLGNSDYINRLSKEVSRIAFTGEARMDDTINRMEAQYDLHMEQANTIHNNIKEQLNSVYAFCNSDQYSDSEKFEAISNFSSFASANIQDYAESKGIAMEIRHNIDSLNHDRKYCDNLRIASNYTDNISSIADFVEKIDFLKDVLDTLEDKNDEQYKEAIEEIDDTTQENKVADESDASKDSAVSIPDSENVINDKSVIKNSEL